jgi:hypothetical protein
MEDVGIFYVHLVNITAIWFTLWTFGIFYGYLVYFSSFWYDVPRKIWQPWLATELLRQSKSFLVAASKSSRMFF